MTLPCGAVTKNKLVKAAMTEGLADAQFNNPTNAHINLYRCWSEGGTGILISGNVMIDRRYLECPRNIVLDEQSPKHEFVKWRDAMKAEGSLAVLQISHPGRQCPVSVTSQPIAPSSVALQMPGMPTTASKLLVAKPREMNDEEILEVVKQFVTTARLARDFGFDGVQVHSAHGYLLSQFLSPKTNLRTDRWGGSSSNRRRLLLEVIKGVLQLRSGNPKFIVSVKLNSADFQKGGFTEDEATAVLKELAGLGVDFVEISGGTYEGAKMMENPNLRKSTREREAFFLQFCEKAVAVTKGKLPLMLTGGFRSVEGMEAALATGAVDLIGVARPLCVEPDLPKLFQSEQKTESAHYDLTLHPRLEVAVGAGIQNLWHQVQIHRLAQGLAPDIHYRGWAYLLGPAFMRTYLWEPRKSATGRALAALGPRGLALLSVGAAAALWCACH